MHRALLFAVGVGMGLLNLGSACGATLLGEIVPQGPDPQGNDIYHVFGINTADTDVRFLDLDFQGRFVNTFPAPLSFLTDPSGFEGFSETFFVIP